MSEISKEKLIQIAAAAEKLVRCKGRYHSEQNYRALAALFGVTTPDLPPLESDLMRERAEPVAWIAAYHGEVYDDITGLTRSAVESYAAKYGWEAALTEITPLYTAPPAPVVPAAYEINADATDYHRGWNACRAAMLESPGKEG